jgi:hypothetical protein
MNTNMRRVALSMSVGLVLSLLAASVSSACSYPGTLTVSYSWPPNATVEVVPGGVRTASVSTAVSNWNNAFIAFGVCNYPKLFVGSSSGPTILMTYHAIAPPPNCPTGSTCFTRGIAHLETASFSGGRLSLVSVEINSSITVASAITEVVAHEIGHTFALADCNYPTCSVNSSVMESGAPATSINSLVGTPGPTGCDLSSVLGVAPDYKCPLPNPCYPCQPGRTGGCICSPIILDTEGTGFNLTDAKNGVLFDISGSGKVVRTAWTAPNSGNAFLALPGSDGLVHDGKQLFGSFTPQPSSSTPNGFAALAVYDDPKNGGNGDGVIDAQDAIFSSLRLWIDENHDGICQPGELHTLPSLGVDAISLDYESAKRTDEFGNLFRYKSRLNPDDPDVSHVGRIAYDIFLVTAPATPASTKNIPDTLVPGTKCSLVPNKGGVLTSPGGF